MPIPIIPIVAALGAGAIGYYIGRTAYAHGSGSINML